MDPPKLIARSFVGGLLTLTVFFGLGAALASSSGDADLPDSIVIPASHMGDRAAFTTSFPQAWPFGLPPGADNGSYVSMGLAWTAGPRMRDVNGTVLDTDRVEIRSYTPAQWTDASGDQEWQWREGASAYFLQAGSDRIVAAEATLDDSLPFEGDTEVLGVPVLHGSGTVAAKARALTVSDGIGGPCFGLNIAEFTIQVGDVLPLPDSCILTDLVQVTTNTTLAAKEVQLRDGWVAIRLDMLDGGLEDLSSPEGTFDFEPIDQATVWLAHGLPYPLEVSWSKGESSAISKLSGYEQGQTLRLPGSSTATSPVRTTPRPVWSIDDSGYQGAFSLSEAFMAAASDPTSPLFEFLQSDPECM